MFIIKYIFEMNYYHNPPFQSDPSILHYPANLCLPMLILLCKKRNKKIHQYTFENYFTIIKIIIIK